MGLMLIAYINVAVVLEHPVEIIAGTGNIEQLPDQY